MATHFENLSSGRTPADLGRFMATFAVHRYIHNISANFFKTSSKLHQNFIKTSSKLHQNFIKTSPKVHQNCIKTVSKLHQNCIKTASKLHQNCIKITSKFHQNCTNYLSKGNPKVEINWQICRTVEVPVISSSHNWCGALHNR